MVYTPYFSGNKDENSVCAEIFSLDLIFGLWERTVSAWHQERRAEKVDVRRSWSDQGSGFGITNLIYTKVQEVFCNVKEGLISFFSRNAWNYGKISKNRYFAG